jgi:hypothetical protein
LRTTWPGFHSSLFYKIANGITLIAYDFSFSSFKCSDSSSNLEGCERVNGML